MVARLQFGLPHISSLIDFPLYRRPDDHRPQKTPPGTDLRGVQGPEGSFPAAMVFQMRNRAFCRMSSRSDSGISGYVRRQIKSMCFPEFFENVVLSASIATGGLPKKIECRAISLATSLALVLKAAQSCGNCVRGCHSCRRTWLTNSRGRMFRAGP